MTEADWARLKEWFGAAIETPERALAPFWPRPAVLPSPEPMPRPTRTRDWRAPLLSLI